MVGALAGGLAGAAIEEGATRGNAMEFIIRDDDGQTRSVIQTNELGLTVGDRVRDHAERPGAAVARRRRGAGRLWRGGYGGGPVDARGGK